MQNMGNHISPRKEDLKGFPRPKDTQDQLLPLKGGTLLGAVRTGLLCGLGEAGLLFSRRLRSCSFWKQAVRMTHPFH